jgi:hypothetical protein
MRGDFFGKQQGDVVTPVRAHYKGVLIGNMGYTPDEAEARSPPASSTPSPSAPPSSPTPTCRRASRPARAQRARSGDLLHPRCRRVYRLPGMAGLKVGATS